MGRNISLLIDFFLVDFQIKNLKSQTIFRTKK